MGEMLSACINRKIMTVFPTTPYLYMITDEGRKIIKENGLDIKLKELTEKHIGDVFGKPEREMDQDTFLVYAQKAIDEKASKEVKDDLYKRVEDIADKTLIMNGDAIFFALSGFLDAALHRGYVRYGKENRVTLEHHFRKHFFPDYKD